MGCGKGINTRVELLALWMVSFVALKMGLPIMELFGDSMIIVNWDAKKYDLHVLELEHWCIRVRATLETFQQFNISHIYREHNTLAGMLSKEALHVIEGLLLFEEFVDDLKIGEGSILVFQH